MKAISFKQPTAQALIQADIRYDIRSWRTGHRGLVYIHAARSPLQELRSLCNQKNVKQQMANWGFNKVEDFPMGAILGTARLEDCIALEDFDFLESNNLGVVPNLKDIPIRGWVWIFSEPVKLQCPRLYRGRLGLFEVSLEPKLDLSQAFPKDTPQPNEGRAFFDGDFKIVTHTHRKLG